MLEKIGAIPMMEMRGKKKELRDRFW